MFGKVGHVATRLFVPNDSVIGHEIFQSVVRLCIRGIRSRENFALSLCLGLG